MASGWREYGGSAAVIPRYQTVLFVVLLAASAVMGVVLWQLRDRAHQRLLQGEDSAPTQAPAVAPSEQATLFVANDADNSMRGQVLSLPLPQSSSERVRAILGKLLDLYAAPTATHPVPGGAASVTQVFLLPVPGAGSNAAEKDAQAGKDTQTRNDVQTGNDLQTGPQLAVVNLTSSFADNHPSGLEAETLTILSICATLHANLPGITQVRFLVNGQPRATLAGHADLARTYLAADAVPTEGANP
jgi:hypothetical protein